MAVKFKMSLPSWILIVPRASLSYCFCFSVTFLLWSITPLSWLYLAGVSFNYWNILPNSFPFIAPLTAYALIECIFSIYYQYLAASIQRRRPFPYHSQEFLLSVFQRSLSCSMGMPFEEARSKLFHGDIAQRVEKADWYLAEDDKRVIEWRNMIQGWFRGGEFSSNETVTLS
jgi:hypothetical protein